MELKQLRYFLAVAETLNFSRAAETLYISQPALSYQIAELEKELGVELFARDRRRVYLTPEGKTLVKPARALVEQADQMPQLVRQGPDTPGGRLRVGFDNTEDHFELIGVTQAIADFALDNPSIKLELRKLPFPACTDQLAYDDLDMAFLVLRHKETLPPQLDSRTIYRSRLVMVVSKDSPAATCEEAVRLHELLLVEEKPRGNSRILRVLEDMKLSPNIRRMDSMTTGFVYAQMGKGIMLMSGVYFSHHNYPGLRAIDLDISEADITHELVWNRATQNPNVQKILDRMPEL